MAAVATRPASGSAAVSGVAAVVGVAAVAAYGDTRMMVQQPRGPGVIGRMQQSAILVPVHRMTCTVHSHRMTCGRNLFKGSFSRLRIKDHRIYSDTFRQ